MGDYEEFFGNRLVPPSLSCPRLDQQIKHETVNWV